MHRHSLKCKNPTNKLLHIQKSCTSCPSSRELLPSFFRVPSASPITSWPEQTLDYRLTSAKNCYVLSLCSHTFFLSPHLQDLASLALKRVCAYTSPFCLSSFSWVIPSHSISYSSTIHKTSCDNANVLCLPCLIQ